MGDPMKKENAFARHYDKILVVFALGVLLFSLYYLTTLAGNRDEIDAKKFTEPKKTVAPLSLKPYEEAAAKLEKPLQLDPPDIHAPGYLIPERRFQCISPTCRKPILLEDQVCPFCEAEQPKDAVLADDYDSDGDGIPDKIEIAWGLNPQDPSDAEGDLDGDGFTNLEEYIAGTDPKDPKSHPELNTLLRVKEIRGKKMPFVFSHFNRMPDGYQLVFIKIPKPKWEAQITATTNSLVGETGFQVIKFQESSEKRKSAKGFMETVDTSTVTVKRIADGREVTIRIRDPKPVETDLEAVVSFERDKQEYVVIKGSKFKVRDENWSVEEIDNAKKSVLIKNDDTGKTKLVPPVE